MKCEGELLIFIRDIESICCCHSFGDTQTPRNIQLEKSVIAKIYCDIICSLRPCWRDDIPSCLGIILSLSRLELSCPACLSHMCIDVCGSIFTTCNISGTQTTYWLKSGLRFWISFYIILILIIISSTFLEIPYRYRLTVFIKQLCRLCKIVKAIC